MERRNFIKTTIFTAFSISSYGYVNWNGKEYVGNNPTTSDILGPYYRPGAPVRKICNPPESKGIPLLVNGKITGLNNHPVSGARVEIWHCDENENYDNTSSDFWYRGTQITASDGEYAFKTIMPVPYKLNPNDDNSWRPAHIHMRIAVKDHQDLITQIYFKNGKYLESDEYSSLPEAINRILPVQSNSEGTSELRFNITLDAEKMINERFKEQFIGVYQVDDSSVEFLLDGDLIFMKWNGQPVESLIPVSDHQLRGTYGYPKVLFKIHDQNNVEVSIELKSKRWNGIKIS